MSHNPGDLATSVPSPLGGVVRAVLAPGPRGDDPPSMSSVEQAPRATRRGSDFAELCRLIRREGLLDRRPRHSGIKFAARGAALRAGGAAFLVTVNPLRPVADH